MSTYSIIKAALWRLQVVFILALLSACNGGGGVSTTAGLSSTSSNAGTANMGVIVGGSVAVNEFVDGAVGAEIIPPRVSDANGLFDLTAAAAAYSGPVILTLSDPDGNATYFNEAAGQMTPFPGGKVLHSVVAQLNGAPVAITPLTEVATQMAISLVATQGLTDVQAISKANSMTSQAFLGGIDPLYTIPVDVRQENATASNSASVYANVLAGIAYVAQINGIDPIDQAALYADNLKANNADFLQNDLGQLMLAIAHFNQSPPANVFVPKVATNIVPVAFGQNVTLDEDSNSNIVLHGGDLNQLPVMFTIETQPQFGRLTGTPPNLLYTPDSNFNGSDSFRFLVNNGFMSSSPTLVNIFVNPVADVPFARDSVFLTAENTPGSGTLPATDADNDPITYSIVTHPAHGSITSINQATGEFVYSPNMNFSGADSFTFRASDAISTSNTASISVSIQNVNNAPIANAELISLDEDTSVNITLLGTDVDANPLVYILSSMPLHGTLAGTLPNMTYTPDLNYSGQDNFRFYVSDGSLNSTEALISLKVNPANDAPLAINRSLTLNQGSSIAFTLDGSDPENDALTYVVTTPPATGTIAGSMSGSLAGMSPLEFTPARDFSGQAQLVYTLDDGNGGSAQGTVTFTVLPYEQSSQDSDGDGLRDSEEISFGTNPNLKDTDGDGFSDYDELVTYAFEASVNNLRFNPLIADTPKIQIDITSPPDFALNYTLDNGSTNTISTNNAVTNGTSIATSNSNENTHSWAYANSIGAEVSIEARSGLDAGYSASFTASYDHEETVTTDSTVVNSSENISENSTTQEKGTAFEESNNISYADGDIDTTVRITNTGHITYTLDNLFLSAYTISKGPNGEEFGSVGQMAFTDVGSDPFPAITLAPNQSTTQLNFTAAGVDLGQMHELMRNSVGLTVKPAIYNLLDSNGKAYNFSATNIGTQTARVIVDFVNNEGRKTIEESIAVHGDPASNISILDALQSVLKLDTVIADADGSTQDINGNPVVQGHIDSIDGLAGNGQYAYWLAVHGQQQGNNEYKTVVYTTPEEVMRWQARNPNYVGNLVSELDFTQTELNAGDVIHLIYMQDDDLDGLSNSEEFLYGTNPQLADSDYDSIDDSVEVKGWDIAYTDEFGSNIFKHVYSNPGLIDSDSDGLTDFQEFIAADPYKRRDPTSADSDGDNLLDDRDNLDNVGALDVSKFDSMMINTFRVASINPISSFPTVEYNLPEILLNPIAGGAGVNDYNVYILRKMYGSNVPAPYPDLDGLPVSGSTLIAGDQLSCAANDPTGDSNCSWRVVDSQNWKIFPAVASAVSFTDDSAVPAGGSIKYKALVSIDGVFKEYPVGALAAPDYDTIEITMKEGVFVDKKTLQGLHGQPIAANTWTHTVNQWMLKGTKYYKLYNYFAGDWFTGAHTDFKVYDVATRVQQPDLIQWTYTSGSTGKKVEDGEFVGDYLYANEATMGSYLNGSQVGDGELDVQWQLKIDGEDLFTPKTETIYESLQAEIIGITPISGATNTEVDNVGAKTYPDIFTQYGVLTKQVAASAPGGQCHDLTVVMREYDKEKGAFNAGSITDTTTYSICPDDSGGWVLSFGGNAITTLRKNNAQTVGTVMPTTSWGAPTSTIQATISAGMEVRIR